jgi:hypothetical protein
LQDLPGRGGAGSLCHGGRRRYRSDDLQFRAAGWSLLNASGDWQKLDSRRIAFSVNLVADGQAIVRYRVCYNW